MRAYLLFALDNGEVRAHSIQNDIDDMSKHQSYQSINMHDNLNGIIPAMCLSRDQKFIFSVGHDGNIFMYDNQTNAKIVTDDYSFDVQLPESISDIYDPSELSLEEQIQRDNLLKHQAAINDKIQLKSENVGDLTMEYLAIKKRNKQLLESIQYKRHEFIFDDRIREAFETFIRNEEQKAYRQVEFDVEKSEIQLKKLKEYFIDVLEEPIMPVSAIR